MPGEDDDESEQIKETFAYFGAAAYMANVLETGLAHVLMHVEFMQKTRDEFARTKGVKFDRAKYEADFDAFMAKQFTKTMGALKKRVEELGAFDDELKRRIHEAAERRNFLLHHFWREKALPFATSEGRLKMNEELNDDAHKFKQLDEDIQAAVIPIRRQLGMKDGVVEAYIEDYMKKVKDGSISD